MLDPETLLQCLHTILDLDGTAGPRGGNWDAKSWLAGYLDAVDDAAQVVADLRRQALMERESKASSATRTVDTTAGGARGT